jgi:hypothetical protein
MKKRILIPLIAGLALLWACKGKTGSELVNNSRSADTVKMDSAATSQPKLIKTAEINFKVISNLGINNAVKNSMVTLSFYQSNTINKEVIANDDPSAYNLPFFKRMGMAIENGWEVFVDVIIALTNLWVFILASIGAWLTIRYYRNKKTVLLAKG